MKEAEKLIGVVVDALKSCEYDVVFLQDLGGKVAQPSYEFNVALVREAADAIEKLEILMADQVAREKRLRRMLCVATANKPYMDDGEAQDNSELPTIDFMRDNLNAIERKLRERNLKKLAAAADLVDAIRSKHSAAQIENKELK